MFGFLKKKNKNKVKKGASGKNKPEQIPTTPHKINPNRPLESTVELAYEKDEAPMSTPTKKETQNFVMPSNKVEAKPKKIVEKKKTKEEETLKYNGKYEVYKEAGHYKYRLKASNGEILAVSMPYTTDKGAISGIETFKKNVEAGVFEIYTDKSNYSQFHLYNANKARVILVGEFYKGVKQAQSAVESVKKFYKTIKIDTISKIPEDEIREELIKFEKIEANASGKYEIYQEGNSYYVRLKANNAQVLFVSSGYSSKASAKQGLETIKTAIAEKRFTVAKDKQDRYQFNLYSATNQLILTGETYPQKSSCISAINSVRKFAEKAKIVEI
ncbi:MAG: YegP family protein [Candidatus Izemoplasmatales bacterium]|jgi:uncharacterized protein YegP (UPF0339 family)|nr:YegP family protein [Candidatus Izemoplasmatales bacterium]